VQCKKIVERMKIVAHKRIQINREFMMYEMEWCDDDIVVDEHTLNQLATPKDTRVGNPKKS